MAIRYGTLAFLANGVYAGTSRLKKYKSVPFVSMVRLTLQGIGTDSYKASTFLYPPNRYGTFCSNFKSKVQ